MPVTLTYPGVYIEEIPSGVRTLTGVATSVTAFIGRAKRGPIDHPVTIFSYADYERAFGGLWGDSDMSYAVRDFYLNGGGQAVIVRVYKQDAASGIASILLAANTELTAASAGAWGTNLRAAVDHDVMAELDEAGAPTKDKFFNLVLTDNGSGASETFRNVTVDIAFAKHPGYLPAVLENRSNLGRLSTGDPTTYTRPAVGVAPAAAGGHDGLAVTATELVGSGPNKTGLYALEDTDIFNLLCIPDALGYTGLAVAATNYCEKRRAMFLIDAPSTWATVAAAQADIDNVPSSTNAAIYFPRLMQPDPLRDGMLVERPPCGAIAGVIARTDAQRGIWKAAAGLDATLRGVPKLSVPLTNDQIGLLNPLGVNCLKTMPPAGRIVWGARTRKGADQLASEWKYVPIRRLALHIEESLFRGTQWVVFEPNDEPLWAQIRLNLGAFMNGLFRKGAFQGSAPADAYFVKCDKETTTQADINLGIVNIVVGFAPLKPAEFVIIKLQQMAGQLAA